MKEIQHSNIQDTQQINESVLKQKDNGLTIDNIEVAYRRKLVFKNFSTFVPIEHGKVTALLGPNGCGKSSLMKALAGLVHMRGKVQLNAHDITQLSFAQRARKAVYMPQTLPPAVHLHVFETVLVAANASALDRAHQTHQEEIDAVYALLEQLDIVHLAMHYLDQLSGGQKQMVALAQVLIRNPQLLLLDEPLSALDLNFQVHVMRLIQTVTKQRNIVTLIVLHDINIALRNTDAALLLTPGALYAQGKPQDIITTQALAQVYGVNARVETCSQGYPQVLIDGLFEDATTS